MAKFYIRDSFVFSSRKLFCLIGDIVDGEVGNGMTLLTDDVRLGNLIIESVEFVRGENQESVGLLFKYDNQEEVEHIKLLEKKIVLIEA